MFRAQTLGAWRTVCYGFFFAIAMVVGTNGVSANNENNPDVSSATGDSVRDAEPSRGGEAGQDSAGNGADKKGNDWTAAAATIIAGALGFAGAVLVERVSWRRRKAEQVRDAQLKKLLLTARDLQEGLNKIEEVQRRFATASENSEKPNAATLNERAMTVCHANAGGLEKMIKETRLDLLELQVLKISQEVIDEIAEIIDRLEVGEHLLRRIILRENGAVKELAEFEVSLDGLTDKAITGLQQR